ncbi:MAG: beta-lactamase family protein [Pirellulales bacterium]|nr:beta-lactamase family protein [Pirellulales bacterium]
MWLKAYGHRQLVPHKVAMTTDTLFDLASVTKPIAMATSVMVLIERGKIELDQPVTKYVPEFRWNGKEGITVRQLLTHQGGLILDNPAADYRKELDTFRHCRAACLLYSEK